MAFRPGFSVRLRSAEHHARQAAMAANLHSNQIVEEEIQFPFM
jgi:hypothetical protein